MARLDLVSVRSRHEPLLPVSESPRQAGASKITNDGRRQTERAIMLIELIRLTAVMNGREGHFRGLA